MSRFLKKVAMLGVVLGVMVVSSSTEAARAEGGLNKTEAEAVKKLLNRYGVVALVENLPNGSPRAMTLAVRVNAPREIALGIFRDPTKFNFISSLFEEGKVLDDHESNKAYSWASRHQLFSVVGTNTVALFPPRRVDVTIVKSSLGKGGVTFDFYEDGKNRTLMVLHGIVNVESSEWLIRFLVGNSPSMKQAMNVAIGLVVIKGTKTMAEMLAGKVPLKKHMTYGKRKDEPLRGVLPQHISLLRPLINRGTVVLTDSLKGGRLEQATVIEKVNAPAAKFVGAVATPEFYPSMLKAMSDIKIHKRDETGVNFSWTLGLSIFGLTTRTQLTILPDGVTWDGQEGDLAGAKWRWQVVPDGQSSCIVAYHGWADILKSTYILEKSMRREPYLEHGFLVGSNLVMLRSVKRTVEKK